MSKSRDRRSRAKGASGADRSSSAPRAASAPAATRADRKNAAFVLPAWFPGIWIARIVLFVLPLVIGAQWSADQRAVNGELGFPMDDPYIHFQFARNLATGHGFSFNPGEPTPGATSPLWVLVLALGRVMGMPLEAGSVVLGVLLTGIAAVLTLEVGIAAGLGVGLAFVAGIATAACGRMTWASLSGMEIGLATALSLAVVRVMQSQLGGIRRAGLIGALAGLAATARPEMVLIGPLALAIEAWRIARREGPAGSFRDLAVLGACFAILLVPYTLFCLATTGRPLPNTYYAKSWILSLNDPMLALRRARYLPIMYNVAWHDNLTYAVLLVPGLIAWAILHMKRGSALVLLWPLAFMTYSIAFYPRHFSVSRYTIPLIPFLALLSMAPLAWLFAAMRAPLVRAVAVGVAAIAISFGAWRSVSDYGPLYLANCDNIVRQQVAAARWVALNLPKDARIATNDVGAITWFGGRYCIDVVGLVSSDFITHMLSWWNTHHDTDTEAALPSYLKVKKPDYAILFTDWYPNLTRAPWLQRVQSFQYSNNTGGGNELNVYRVAGEPAELPASPSPAGAGK